MARITGVIYIDFETDKSISQAQFNGFERKINSLMTDWESALEEACAENKFESQEVHSILLDSLDCEFDKEEY